MREKKMTTTKLSGGCHCGNISFQIEFANDASSYSPRACDCDFCNKHGATYISDKNGLLTITIDNESSLSRYRQGSGIAEFLLCKGCGVLVGVVYEEAGQIYGSINSKSINHNTDFGKELVVSPKRLNDSERIERWKDLWFSKVEIKGVCP
jgi:hypothetical protein